MQFLDEKNRETFFLRNQFAWSDVFDAFLFTFLINKKKKR
jgi:hypothetical protein